jgi:SAM-dependent methyltransferase
VKCSGCGVLYVSNPPPPEAITLAHQYGTHVNESESKPGRINSTGKFRKRRITRHLKILRDIYRNEKLEEITISTQKPTWLDVGCGHGEFLLALKDFSKGHLDYYGIEPNKTKALTCKKLGISTISEDLADIENKFNYISLMNVFSHLENPRIFLKLIHSHLQNNGELLLETGDTANLPLNKHPRPLYLPDHLIFSNQQLTQKILEDIGFTILSTHKYENPNHRNLIWVVLKELHTAYNQKRVPNSTSILKTWISGFKKLDMFIRAKKLD